MVYWLHKSTPLHNVDHFLKVSNRHSFCLLKLWQSELFISVHEPPDLVALTLKVQKACISFWKCFTTFNIPSISLEICSCANDKLALFAILPHLHIDTHWYLKQVRNTPRKWFHSLHCPNSILERSLPHGPTKTHVLKQ